MGTINVRRKALPELYVHFKLNKKLTPTNLFMVKTSLAEVGEKTFWEFFGKPSWSDPFRKEFYLDYTERSTTALIHHKFEDQTPKDYEMIVILEEGSLIIKIIPTVVAICIAIGSWGSFVNGAEDISTRLRSAYDFLLPRVQEVVGAGNIQEKIKHERRIGAIGRLDELIQDFQNEKISEEIFLGEGSSLVHVISMSEDGAILIPIVKHHFLQQYNYDIDILRDHGQNEEGHLMLPDEPLGNPPRLR